MADEKLNRPDIFGYMNYRSFLRDNFAYAKKNEGLTLREFARKADFGSHGYLKKVIDGERAASAQGAYKFAKGFGLSTKEADYLELLIRFAESSSTDEKNAVYTKLIKLKPRDPIAQIEKKGYQVFSKWYILAVRELVLLPEFTEDAKWIASALEPSITPAQAQEALDLLLELEYLKRNEAGKLEQAEPMLTTGAEVRSLAVINYHNNMLNLASKAMENIDETWRDVSSVSIMLDREEFNILKKRIVDFRAELLQFVLDRAKAGQNGNTSTNEHIIETKKHLYNLNMQFFSSTKVDWKKETK